MAQSGQDVSRLIGKKINETMLHTLTILTVLRLLSDAKLSCHRGHITYERIPNHKLVGFQEKTLRDVVDPAEMVQNCINWCNTNITDNTELAACGFFNFESGQSSARLNSSPDSHRWRESKCNFALVGVYPEAEAEVKLIKDLKYDHFAQICIKKETGAILKEKCPNKLYSFNRFPGMKFMPSRTKRVMVQSREECQDRCLSEKDFLCRSASFEMSVLTCYLSDMTADMSSPGDLTDNADFDYMENVCLTGDNRCKEGINRFVSESQTELANVKDAMSMPLGTNLDQCRKICRDDKGILPFFCKSFHFDSDMKLCLLSEHTSDKFMGQKSVTNSSHFTYFESVCIQGGNVMPRSDSVVMGVSQGSESAFEPFRLLRNTLLEAEPYAVYQDYTLGKCLDECLYKDINLCKSAGFNTQTNECRLNKFGEKEARMTFHPEFNFYQNLEGGRDVQSDGRGRYYYQNYDGPSGLQPPRRNPASVTNFNFPPSNDQVTPLPSKSSPDETTRDQRRSNVKCDSSQDLFRQLRSRTRLRPEFILSSYVVSSFFECEKMCLQETQFECLSFNFIQRFSANLPINCELSDQSAQSLDLTNPAYFEISEEHDFYVRDRSRSLDPCVDVSQECTPFEMVFTLRTHEGFRGRIYTYKNFDVAPCFVRGNGGQSHKLRIPKNGCGTERYGDTQVNIVVVQHSELVQTSKDTIYNLTCTVRHPGDAVVSSSYIGAGSGEPTQILELPAEYTLDSRVNLEIEYKSRPTTTIAVGDELTFKLKTHEGENLVTDIFATNVVAKDPYTQRSVELIDQNGCPVDPNVFPSLGLSRSGDGLEANFYAFKIPESNFLVFEATVSTCRGGCKPAECRGPAGRSLNSFGRKKRDTSVGESRASRNMEENINLREMFRVYEKRNEITAQDITQPTSGDKLVRGTCLSDTEYYGLIVTIILLIGLVIVVTVMAGVCFRKAKQYSDKLLNAAPITANFSSRVHMNNGGRREVLNRNPVNSPAKRAFYLPEVQHASMETLDEPIDPSEPICADTTLFEQFKRQQSRL